MKEETTQIGGRRKLADLFDIALPTQQRRGLQRAVLMAVIDSFEPMPQALVELLDREQNFGIERGQKLFARRTEEAFDLAAAFGLIRRRMHDEDADGGGDAGQLRGAVNLGIVHVEA